jgi:hypothetical protein
VSDWDLTWCLLLRLDSNQQHPIIDQLEPTVTGYADGDP